MNESTALEQDATSKTAKPVAPSPMRGIGNALLVTFLVLLGLFLGSITAIFIGLSSGWIEISC